MAYWAAQLSCRPGQEGKGTLLLTHSADSHRQGSDQRFEAASRLEDYANSVREVQALEDMSLDYKEISLAKLMKEMQTQISILSEQHHANIHISADLPEQTVSPAPTAVFRIVENIVSNAPQYCQSQIDMDFFLRFRGK